MFKAISTGLLMLVVAAFTAPAGAQDTIAIYADYGGGEGLSRSLITKVGEPFDIVVVTKTNLTSSLIEFKMTELQNLYAGVFKQSTTRFGGQAVIFGDDDIGEHAFGYGECAPAGQNDILRIRYYDVDGSLPRNVVLAVWAPGFDTTYKPTMDGQMGYVDCTDAYGEHVLTPEAWDASSGLDPSRIDGVTSTDGILVLNPQNLGVPTDAHSIGTLKARF